MAQTKLIDLDRLTQYDAKIKELIASETGNTTYTLSAGTGADAEKIVLTDSNGNEDKVTVPYANNAGTVNSHTVEKNVPADAKFTDTTYSDATTSTSGLMSATDKGKVNGLGTASTKNVAASGNASNSEVVMGNDTRLSDSRPASDVSAWAKASTKPSYTASEVGAIATTAKGANNGVAELDSTGKVPSSQLPSYVDDVVEGYLYEGNFYEEDTHETEIPAESGKIYVDLATDLEYRWGGSAYAEISKSLALGETSSTAYAGNKGKANADAIAAIKDGSTIDSFSDVESALSNKVDKVSGKGLSTNDYTTTEKNKLSGIATGAEVNQNAFSKVTVGSTTIAANSKTDIFNIVAGSNITLTPDATNKKLTMAATDTKYTAATAAPGNIASSGAVGTSTNYARQDHTHGITVATGDAAGQVKIAGQNVSVNGFGNKQDKTDNTLQTTDKTIPGAINELKRGLMVKQDIYGNATKLGEIAADATSAGVTATKNGYLSLFYEMTTSDRSISGRIRDGNIVQLGASFSITARAYTAEPICTIPCENGHTYSVEVAAGHDGISIYQL